MTCDLTQTLLDTPMASPPAPDMLAGVRTHAAGCPACAERLAEWEALAAVVGTLPRSVQPDRPLWEGIAARTGRRHSRWPWALAAAAVLATVLLTQAVVRPGSGRDAALFAGGPPPAVAGAPVARAADYRAAADELEQAVATGAVRLLPHSNRALTASLAALDAAEAEAREALARAPDNPAIQAAYLAAVRHRLTLLRQAAQFEGSD